MHKILFSIVFTALVGVFSVVEAGVPDPTDFPFERKVVLPQGSSGNIELALSPAVMQKINENFSNFNIVNSKNEEVPFSLFAKPTGKTKDLKIAKISSQKSDSPQNLIDNDPLTEFSFDERVDGKNDSWVLIDLGSMMSINRIKVLPKESAKIRSVEIKAGATPDDLKTVYSKRGFARYLDVTTPLVRYVKVSLWGISVKLLDVQFYVNGQAIVYFQAEPGEKYRALYGGPRVSVIRYKEKTDKEKSGNFLSAELTKETWNPIFPKDFDDDGYDNPHDNCPFVSNPTQWDKDEDRVGNKCDNAPKIKNSKQFDADRDGVGDITDNCKLTKNPDQADRDGDEFGDACDSAHAKEKTHWEFKDIKHIIIGLILVGLGGFLFFFWRKIGYNEKK